MSVSICLCLASARLCLSVSCFFASRLLCVVALLGVVWCARGLVEACLCAKAFLATLLLDPWMLALLVKEKRLLAVALSTDTNCDNMAYHSLCCLLDSLRQYE